MTKGRAGQLEEALTAQDAVIALVEETDAHYDEAEPHRIRADGPRMEEHGKRGTVRSNPADDAPRRQAAGSLEARATVSLCRLWVFQVMCGQAGGHLYI